MENRAARWERIAGTRNRRFELVIASGMAFMKPKPETRAGFMAR